MKGAPVASAIARANKAKKKPRTPEEAVAYAVGHRIRVEIIAALNEGPRYAEQLARLVGVDRNKIDHHLRELLKDGSIEIAEVEPLRNFERVWYRAVKQVYYNDDEFAELTPEEKKVTLALPLRSIMAESLSSLGSGKMLEDRETWVSWRWFNVDSQGRTAINKEQERFWTKMREIETESVARRIESGEAPLSIVVAELGFERCRPSENLPDSIPDLENDSLLDPEKATVRKNHESGKN
jgi:DNA-binding transcriptional ArsR family regulator